jgi:hypothetical protein
MIASSSEKMFKVFMRSKVRDLEGRYSYAPRHLARIVEAGRVPSLTLICAADEKGSNHSATCSSTVTTGQNGYTWMKNGELVSAEMDVVTEDLYPDGSRIYIADIQVCNVSFQI